jgi:hypothetical protein
MTMRYSWRDVAEALFVALLFWSVFGMFYMFAWSIEVGVSRGDDPCVSVPYATSDESRHADCYLVIP